MDSLGRFANHAAMTLAAVEAARRADALLEAGEEPLARLATALERLEGPGREAAVATLEALAALLRAGDPG
jgi:hypothetical protein